jgi:hypothetical protein
LTNRNESLNSLEKPSPYANPQKQKLKSHCLPQPQLLAGDTQSSPIIRIIHHQNHYHLENQRRNPPPSPHFLLSIPLSSDRQKNYAKRNYKFSRVASRSMTPYLSPNLNLVSQKRKRWIRMTIRDLKSFCRCWRNTYAVCFFLVIWIAC